MFAFLAYFAIAVGLLTLASIVLELRVLLLMRRAEPTAPFKVLLYRLFCRWTWLDVALSALFIIGMLFLIADLSAMIRDRDLYPMYRIGYLFSALFYLLFGMLMLWGRMFVVLSFSEAKTDSASTDSASTDSASTDSTTTAEEVSSKPDEQTKPSPTDQTKDTEN